MASKGLLLLLLAMTLLSVCRGRFLSVPEREIALDYPAEAASELLAMKKNQPGKRCFGPCGPSDYNSYGSGNANTGMSNTGSGHNNDIGIGSNNANTGDINNSDAFLRIQNNGGRGGPCRGPCGGNRANMYGNNNRNTGMFNSGTGHNNKVHIGSGNKGAGNLNNSGATLHIQNN